MAPRGSQPQAQPTLSMLLEGNHRLRGKKEQLADKLAGLRQQVTEAENALADVDEQLEDNQRRIGDAVQGTKPRRRSTLEIPALTEDNGSLDQVEEKEACNADHQPRKVSCKRRGLPKLSKHSPTVVDLDSVWTEVWCHACGANSSEMTEEFFNGTLGLTRHYAKKHRDLARDGFTWEKIAAMCGRRILTREDIEGLASGQISIEVRSPGHGVANEQEQQQQTNEQHDEQAAEEQQQANKGQQQQAEQADEEQQQEEQASNQADEDDETMIQSEPTNLMDDAPNYARKQALQDLASAANAEMRSSSSIDADGALESLKRGTPSPAGANKRKMAQHSPEDDGEAPASAPKRPRQWPSVLF